MLLSIIIPFYKSEQFIVDCLDSAACQMTDECELVLVDDGSPDRTLDIVLNRYGYLISVGAFVLVRIKNSGPGAARNAGVKVSRGKYIGFLDSDDVLSDQYIKTLLPLLQQGRTDIVQFNYKRFSDSGLMTDLMVYKSHHTLGQYELCQVRNEIFGVGSWFPCTRVFRRGLVESNPFPVGVFYEDVMTIPMIFLGNFRIELIADSLYGYRANLSSTTSNHTAADAETLRAFFSRILLIEESVPINILKIQVARTLSYFSAELRLNDFSSDGVAATIKSIGLKRDVKKYLKIADRVFLEMPWIYFQLDRLRMRTLLRRR